MTTGAFSRNMSKLFSELKLMITCSFSKLRFLGTRLHLVANMTSVIKEFRCFEVKIEESKKASSRPSFFSSIFAS